MSKQPWGEAATPYEEIGGPEPIRSLVEIFYDLIESTSPRLRSMLPEDTTETREKFFSYLSGWLGGPPLYSDRYGHPQLRMRHSPFEIGEFEAGEWMRCMDLALESLDVGSDLTGFLHQRFDGLARHLINRPA